MEVHVQGEARAGAAQGGQGRSDAQAVRRPGGEVDRHEDAAQRRPRLRGQDPHRARPALDEPAQDPLTGGAIAQENGIHAVVVGQSKQIQRRAIGGDTGGPAPALGLRELDTAQAGGRADTERRQDGGARAGGAQVGNVGLGAGLAV